MRWWCGACTAPPRGARPPSRGTHRPPSWGTYSPPSWSKLALRVAPDSPSWVSGQWGGRWRHSESLRVPPSPSESLRVTPSPPRGASLVAEQHGPGAWGGGHGVTPPLLGHMLGWWGVGGWGGCRPPSWKGGWWGAASLPLVGHGGPPVVLERLPPPLVVEQGVQRAAGLHIYIYIY
jgi:hypothetical protein